VSIGLDEPYRVFISEDPIGLAGGINQFAYADSVGKPFSSQTNLYQYASNNPVTRIDPYGLFDTGMFLTGFFSTLEGIGTMPLPVAVGVLTFSATQNPWLTGIVVVETSPAFWAGWTKTKHGWEDIKDSFKEPGPPAKKKCP
jgi:hypothetical protein